MRAGRSRLRQRVVELRRRHASESRRRLARDGRVEQLGSEGVRESRVRYRRSVTRSRDRAWERPRSRKWIRPNASSRLSSRHQLVPATLCGHSARAEHWAVRALAGAGFRNLGVRRALGKHQASKHLASTRQASDLWHTSKWASTGRASGQHTLSGNMSGTRLLPPPRGGRR